MCAKRLLLTGATGFIGRYLLDEALKQQELKTYVAIRKESNVAALRDLPIELIELDYYSEDQIYEALCNIGPIDFVVHNAGVTKCKDRQEYYVVNSEHTRRLLGALKRCEALPKCFLYMSSMGSYGANETNSPLRSDMPQHPYNDYGCSKWQAEQHVIQSSIPYVILCPTGVYGYGDQDYLLSIEAMRKGWSFLSGREPQHLSFVYVEDVARAVFFLLQNPSAYNDRYLLCDGKWYLDSEFTEIVSELIGKPVRELRVPISIIRIACELGDFYGRVSGNVIALNRDKYPILRQRNWLCDISPLLELGFVPKYDLKSGLEDAFSRAKII